MTAHCTFTSKFLSMACIIESLPISLTSSPTTFSHFTIQPQWPHFNSSHTLCSFPPPGLLKAFPLPGILFPAAHKDKFSTPYLSFSITFSEKLCPTTLSNRFHHFSLSVCATSIFHSSSSNYSVCPMRSKISTASFNNIPSI